MHQPIHPSRCLAARHGGRRAPLHARNDAYERAAQVDRMSLHRSRRLSRFPRRRLRGLDLDGAERPGARDRNGARNALFADLLVTTGLRLEEASSCLLEMPVCRARRRGRRLVELPAALTKGDRGRSMLLPRPLLQRLQPISRWSGPRRRQVQGPSGLAKPSAADFIHRPTLGAIGCSLRDGGTIPI